MFGVPIKYGEDRFLTESDREGRLQDRQYARTRSAGRRPPTIAEYFSQQLPVASVEHRRFLVGATHIWRRHPLITLHYVSMFAMLLSYPVVVFSNLVPRDVLRARHFSLRHAGAARHPVSLRCSGSAGIAAASTLYGFSRSASSLPVTYVLYTPLALFTLDSSSWETPGAHRPSEPDAASARCSRRIGLPMTARNHALTSVGLAPDPAEPGSSYRPYKFLGLCDLFAILLGLGLYLGQCAFYFVHRAWVAPMIITGVDPHVQDLSSRHARNRRGAKSWLGRPRELRARLADAERTITGEGVPGR